MSTNLYAKDEKGNDIPLWQTPTWVTYMCLESWKKHDGGYPKKRKWKDTRKLYLDWVESLSSGEWKDRQAYLDMVKNIEEHKELINSHKKIKFYTV